MHLMTNKTRDRLIFSAIIFALTIVAIATISYISPVTALVFLVFLAGLKLGDFIVGVTEWLVDRRNET